MSAGHVQPAGVENGPVHQPPELMTCGPVRLRRWRTEDAPALGAATRDSWDHLRPWMPWADQRPDEETQRPWLLAVHDQWDAGEAYQFAVLPRDADTVVGSIGLMRRIGPGGLEIGYWVTADHVGRGLATCAAAALTWAGLQLAGVRYLEIRCDEANAASAAVPARLGYHLAQILHVPVEAPSETGRQQVWRLTAEQWPTSAAAGLVQGEPLDLGRPS
jgi:RimJ/RimL family protein N-acetyltransferase